MPEAAAFTSWQVRLYVSSYGRRHAVLGGTTCHPTEQDAKQHAEHGLNLLRDYDQRRPYVVLDICYVATVQSPSKRLTGYLVDDMRSIDWDEIPEMLNRGGLTDRPGQIARTVK